MKLLRSCPVCGLPIGTGHPVLRHQGRPAHAHCRLAFLERKVAAEQKRAEETRRRARALRTGFDEPAAS